MKKNLLVLMLGVGVIWGLSTACTPQIGDSCLSNIECPEFAICDTSTLGGYCMSLDCSIGGCPEEAVCVQFRSFNACMAHCSLDEDCRVEDGQLCRNDLSPVGFCYAPAQEPQ